MKLLSVSFPEELTFGDEFEGQVTFANVGGEQVEENAEIQLHRLTTGDEEPQTAELNAEGLKSGETKSHSIGRFEATAAGDYRLESGVNVYSLAEEIEPLVSVEPAEYDRNTQIELPDGLRYTVTDVRFEQSLLNVNSDGRPELRTTLEDRILAVFNLTVANPQTDSREVSAERISVPNGSGITGMNDPVLEGEQLSGRVVNPGESVTGWMAFVVPQDSLADLTFGINLAGTDSPAEAIVDVGQESPSVPQFELAEQTFPATFNDDETEFTFEIANTGDEAGTFRGLIEFLFLEDPGIFSSYQEDTWYKLDGSAMTAVIPPGDTRTVSATTSYSGDIEVNYRLQPFGYEQTVKPN
ncbi:DUF4352 domain-containing protein [Haloarcula marina]|uniref:DUF4352 domain-containing protein n=1 Tax=Haloarcula marina TaxID=2961574 RepID=UPI0020B6BDE4|nr:DUF4352 domain-containing protein [Halomicroarcula marina]